MLIKWNKPKCCVVVVQSPSHVWFFATQWTAACQASQSLTISWSLPKFMSIASVMPFHHLIVWHFLSFCPQSFPALVSFPMSCLFTSDDQNNGASASASVLPMSIQGWFPLRLTGLISLLLKLLSGEFSSTVVQRYQLFGICLLYDPAVTTIYDQWKTITLTIWIFVGRVIMSLLFNTLSRFVIVFQPRNSRHDFMAAVTICSDFRAQEEEICHYFHLFSLYLSWSNGVRYHDLSFCF